MTEDEVRDCMRWADEALDHHTYSRRHRLIKCRAYLEEGIERLDVAIDDMDELNIPEDDWRDDR